MLEFKEFINKLNTKLLNKDYELYMLIGKEEYIIEPIYNICGEVYELCFKDNGENILDELGLTDVVNANYLIKRVSG